MSVIDREINFSKWCVTIRDALEGFPPLRQFANDKDKIDLGNPEALRAYNQAIAKIMLGLEIVVPKTNLIPAICLRNAYIKVVTEFYQELFQRKATTLAEVGTGPSAILAMIGTRYADNIVASEIDPLSLKFAQDNITRNNLSSRIDLIKSEGQIIADLFLGSFDILISYPPIYPEYDRERFEKMDPIKRGFKGSPSEMIGGAEDGFAFTRQMLTEAMDSGNFKLITFLSVFERHVKPAIDLITQNGFQYAIFRLIAGTRIRYAICAYSQ